MKDVLQAHLDALDAEARAQAAPDDAELDAILARVDRGRSRRAWITGLAAAAILSVAPTAWALRASSIGTSTIEASTIEASTIEGSTIAAAVTAWSVATRAVPPRVRDDDPPSAPPAAPGAPEPSPPLSRPPTPSPSPSVSPSRSTSPPSASARSSARPDRAVRARRAIEPPDPAPPAPSEPELAVSPLYARAHELHFRGGHPADALRAWDAYLSATPDASDLDLRPEARFNRAVCLVRLARRDDAERALGDIVTARGYRYRDAQRMLQSLGSRQHIE
ncbi:MAG: hypothetical protein AB7S26_40105 [Sandaracinaceae bacterium]